MEFSLVSFPFVIFLSIFSIYISSFWLISFAFFLSFRTLIWIAFLLTPPFLLFFLSCQATYYQVELLD